MDADAAPAATAGPTATAAPAAPAAPAVPGAAPPAVPAAARSASSRDRVSTVAGIVIIAALCAICVALVFRGGGYVASSWLPLAIVTAALALLVTLSGPAAVSDRFQKVLLGLFGVQVVWTFASMIWASSTGNAWEEANRTLFYAVAIALVFVAVRWAGLVGLTALAGMLAGRSGREHPGPE